LVDIEYMSMKASRYVWDHSRLRGSAFLLHLALAYLANQQDGYEISISQGDLADMAAVSPLTVRRAIATMLDDASIVELPQPPDWHPNRGKPVRRFRFLFQRGAT
jgi:hypothetical protein